MTFCGPLKKRRVTASPPQQNQGRSKFFDDDENGQYNSKVGKVRFVEGVSLKKKRRITASPKQPPPPQQQQQQQRQTSTIIDLTKESPPVRRGDTNLKEEEPRVIDIKTSPMTAKDVLARSKIPPSNTNLGLGQKAQGNSVLLGSNTLLCSPVAPKARSVDLHSGEKPTESELVERLTTRLETTSSTSRVQQSEIHVKAISGSLQDKENTKPQKQTKQLAKKKRNISSRHDAKTIFDCLNKNKNPPSHLQFRIISVDDPENIHKDKLRPPYDLGGKSASRPSLSSTSKHIKSFPVSLSLVFFFVSQKESTFCITVLSQFLQISSTL
jgi:hypothetical protein